MAKINGIVFDKDGTLFDFNATWGAWTREMLTEEAGPDAGLLAQMAHALGYDLARGVFYPDSVVIFETVDVVAARMLAHLPGHDGAALVARMNLKSAAVPQVEATPLVPFMSGLRDKGLRLGLATNDSEVPARVHLTNAGIADAFDFIAGFDSGHGAKPGPGQLLAFCAATGLDPAQCAMIGDSLHDMHAARSAGMLAVGVLTGPAAREELAPAADVVLGSIAEIPAWLNA
jgi:phosphoglycolate phosphatase